jgi:hypothetical protein
MRSLYLITAILLFGRSLLPGQVAETKLQAPQVNDFKPIYQFLASPWMEGRESFEKGGFLAADFISLMMNEYGLIPAGNFKNPKLKGTKDGSYFQDFQIISFRVVNSSLSVQRHTKGSPSIIRYLPQTDYALAAFPDNIQFQGPMVFAGYGITSAETGYDDYKGLDVRNKMVVVLDGYPGYKDTTSVAWKKSGTRIPDLYEARKIKHSIAGKNGAIALIVITEGEIDFIPANSELASIPTMDNEINKEEVYHDNDYLLPQDISNAGIPIFLAGGKKGMEILSGSGINAEDFERKSAQLHTSSGPVKDKSVEFSIAVERKPLLVRNVIGMIQGKDTGKCIILGAHYDHLGKRNDDIFYGADDNASGTAGLLALAKMWNAANIKPACNILFAAWTAEEKGLLGSRYFATTLADKDQDILLYLNMDMISRSESDDSIQNRLSIGIRQIDKNLAELARIQNTGLKIPFELDLWDVTGRSGSDYGSFLNLNIPVMTFNSGLHNDYHTSADAVAKADFKKMEKVLNLVHICILSFLNQIEK